MTYGGRGPGSEYYGANTGEGEFIPTKETLDAYNEMMGLGRSGTGGSRGSSAAAIKETTVETNKLMEAFIAAQKATDDLSQSMAQTFGDGVTSIVDGTMTIKDAFREMARDILKQLWDVYVMQKIIGSASGGTGIAGMITGALGGGGFSKGGSGVSGGLKSFAGDGYSGDGPRSGGLDGQGGFMAMLHPRETVSDHTKGQSSGSTTIVQNFNFSANGDDSVKKIIAQAAPQIAQMTQKTMMDQRRRGGAMKATFG